MKSSDGVGDETWLKANCTGRILKHEGTQEMCALILILLEEGDIEKENTETQN